MIQGVEYPSYEKRLSEFGLEGSRGILLWSLNTSRELIRKRDLVGPIAVENI